MPYILRSADESDAYAIATIYNEGILEREATFETEFRHASDFLGRITSDRYPLQVAEIGGQVIGWAGIASYSDRQVYAGVAELSIYVAGSTHGQGVGTALCERIQKEAAILGFYKLLGKVFPSNAPCVRLLSRCGFREVGLHRRHGRLDEQWRDVLLMERLLGDGLLSQSTT
jgi:L-amino acid N-acyltransferase YncA